MRGRQRDDRHAGLASEFLRDLYSDRGMRANHFACLLVDAPNCRMGLRFRAPAAPEGLLNPGKRLSAYAEAA